MAKPEAMKPPEYVGYWVCLRCGEHVWAHAVLEDPLSYPPCPKCKLGRMRVERRSEHVAVRRERRVLRPELA